MLALITGSKTEEPEKRKKTTFESMKPGSEPRKSAPAETLASKAPIANGIGLLLLLPFQSHA